MTSQVGGILTFKTFQYMAKVKKHYLPDNLTENFTYCTQDPCLAHLQFIFVLIYFQFLPRVTVFTLDPPNKSFFLLIHAQSQ